MNGTRYRMKILDVNGNTLFFKYFNDFYTLLQWGKRHCFNTEVIVFDCFKDFTFKLRFNGGRSKLINEEEQK